MRSLICSSRQDNRRRRFFLRQLTLLSVLLVLIVAAALSAVLAGAKGAKSGERATTAVEQRLSVNSVMPPLAVSGTSLAVSPPFVTVGTAENFGVLGGSTVTNSGATTVNGNVGVSPGSAVTGFPPGVVVGGAIHSNDAVAMQAQNDLTTAYNNTAATPCTVDLTGSDLGGLTLRPGIYCFSSTAGLTGPLTLDAMGNSNARFVFKIGSTLTTASSFSVTVINGGSNCDRVIWQAGSSAMLGAGSSFVGDILALTSISLGTGTNTTGKVLARNGPVTLDTNNVNSCSTTVCPIITVNPASLPNGSVGTPYNQTVSASGGTAPYTFAISIGSLPNGLLLNSSTGAITGTPTTAGTFSFTVTATDANGCSGNRSYSNSIASPGCPAIILNPSTVPPGTAGTPYNQTVSASGGTTPYTFAISSGSLPGGLTLNPATGAISGTPTQVGLFNFQIGATDAVGCQGARQYSLLILCSTNPVVTTNADSGVGSLRQAIIDACDGSTITFDMTQVVSPITLTSGELAINKNLTIQGPGASQLTVSGNNASRVFNVTVANPGAATFSGLTVSNGKSNPGFGGGINNNSTGTVNTTNSALTNNTAASGGGIFNNTTGTINITNTVISGNLIGGGVYNNGLGAVNVTNSTLNGNSAVGGGGGIFNLTTGTISVTNSTISGNNATGGGGVANSSTGLVQIRNSIVALNSTNNIGPDLSGSFNTQGHNLIGKNDGAAPSFSAGTPNANGDIVGTSAAAINPLVGPLVNNGGPTQTMALLAGSPALDAGDNCVTNPAHCSDSNISQLTTDQRGSGFARAVDGPDADTTDTVDIGAFEAQVSVEDITDKITNEDTQLQFTFNVGGAASITSVTATSSNTALVPNNVANIAVSGSGSTRTLTINPAANANTQANGTATITVAVNGANSQSMTDTFVLTVNPIADTPSVNSATTTVNTQTASGLVISRNAADSTEVTNFKITNIQNGTLFKNNGTTQINNNDFITAAEGNAGLRFTPANNLSSPATTFSFDVQASLSNLNAGLGGSTATAAITVNCGSNIVTNSNDTGAGSLRAIINAACPGSTITFAAGLVSPITLTSGELVINKNLTIQGPGAGTLTVSGNNASRVVNVLAGNTVTISDLTIANGNVPGNNGGGGVLNSGTLTMTNCNVYSNSAGGSSSGGSGSGGGISSVIASLTLNNCNIGGLSSGQPNSSALVGGIDILGGTFVMTGGSIVGNAGIGIRNAAGTVTLNGVTITNNINNVTRGDQGGGIALIGGTSNIINCLIANNTALMGGGIYINKNGATVTIVNSTISGNNSLASSGSSGGGIHHDSGSTTLTNVTITNNRVGSGSTGGGLTVVVGMVALRNTIVASNFKGASPSTTADDVDAVLDPASSFNLIGTGGSGGLTNGVNNNQVGVSNPLLGALANNGGPTQTHALLPGSPVINAGSNAFITNPPFTGPPFTDQRGAGFARITNTTVDIGAFESRGFTIVVTSGSSQSTPILSAFGTSLIATVDSPFSEPVAGGLVTLAAPSMGASCTFLPGNVTTTTATINSSHVAVSSTLTANTTVGGPYNVVGSIGSGLPTVNFALTNLKGNQTITFGALANKTFGDPDFSVNATASSALAVSFTASGQCTIAGTTVHLTGPGSCTITAKQAGDSNFNAAADVPRSFTISGALVSLSQANYPVNESTGFVTITVNRTGDLSVPVTVDYATDDTGSSNVCSTLNSGLASSRCDFGSTLGTLKFAATETQKTFMIPITQDSYTEGPEMFTVNLSNLTGTGAAFATPSSATVTINDSTAPAPNASDDTDAFVRQHYRDFLNREADPAGLAFWTGEINNCTPKPQCTDLKRINTSAAFFLSIEFQTTGNLVRSFYVAALNRPLTNNMAAFVEFERDTQALQRGVIVDPNNNAWQAILNANRSAFMNDFVTRAEFIGLYPTTDTPAQYVDKLYLHANVTPATPAERQAAIDEFAGAGTAADPGARGRALIDVTQNSTFQTREMNRSFVQMEYFGYLRRNPNDAPDGNFAGYDFWVNKLNAAGGNFVTAEMVKAFIISSEYRKRFGPN